ncbi:Protein phosphatase 2C 2 [Neurospora sp. IMI 360204]|nr:Protein phosphatase 2C 2 [Neurospora sp. IMI 360204]
MSLTLIPYLFFPHIIAEFRGPGVHHNFDDSDSGYDLEDSGNKGKPFGMGGYKGRIIFLGDGTEVLTDADDTEMFDNAEEDKDLASQVSKSPSSTTQNDQAAQTSAADQVQKEQAAVAAAAADNSTQQNAKKEEASSPAKA